MYVFNNFTSKIIINNRRPKRLYLVSKNVNTIMPARSRFYNIVYQVHMLMFRPAK